MARGSSRSSSDNVKISLELTDKVTPEILKIARSFDVAMSKMEQSAKKVTQPLGALELEFRALNKETLVSSRALNRLDKSMTKTAVTTQKTREKTGDLNRTMKSTTGTASKFNLKMLLATGGVVGFGFALSRANKRILDFASESARSSDSIAKVSKKLGIASDDLQAFQFGAQKNGVQLNTLNMGFQRFVRRLGEAKKGGGESLGAFQQLSQMLGKDLLSSSLSSTQVFGEVADALSNVQDPAEKLRLAFKLFDSEGVGLVNMFRDGKKGLADFKAEAQGLGIIIPEKTLKASEDFNDKLLEIDGQFKAIKSKISEGVFEGLSVELDTLVKTFQNPETMGAITEFFNSIVAGVNLGVRGIAKVQGWITSLAKTINGDYRSEAQKTAEANIKLAESYQKLASGENIRKLQNAGFDFKTGSLEAWIETQQAFINELNNTKPVVPKTQDLAPLVTGAPSSSPSTAPVVAKTKEVNKAKKEGVSLDEIWVSVTDAYNTSLTKRIQLEQSLGQTQARIQATRSAQSRFGAPQNLGQQQNSRLSDVQAEANARMLEEQRNFQIQLVENTGANDEQLQLIAENHEAKLTEIKEQAELKRLNIEREFATKRQSEISKTFRFESSVVSGTIGLLNTLANQQEAGSKKRRNLAIASKTLAIGQATINTALGVTEALGSAPPPFNFINAGLVGTAGGIQIATISSQKLATGGLVGDGVVQGNSTTGDRINTSLNTGEVVFNKAQQMKLFSIINSGGGGSRFEVGNIVVNSDSGDPVGIKTAVKNAIYELQEERFL